MSEVIETQAEPIEEAIEPTSGLDQLVAGITSEAERLAQEYMPREIVTDEDYKQSKRERTGARKDIAALKGRYDERMRAIKDAVKEADARVKAALAPLDAIDSGYKAEVETYESRWKSARLAALAEAYADYAPDLIELVPFERLLGRFGTEKGRQWDARSVSDAQAEEAMHKAVQAIASDEATIDSSPYDDADKAALKADYFATLDLSGALRRTQEAKEQRERVARLEQERREREAEQRRLAEEAGRRMAEAQQAMPVEHAAQPEQQPKERINPDPFQTHMTPQEYVAECERMGTPLGPKSALLQEVAVTMGSPAPGEAVPDYVFAGYGNAAQADAFTDFCNRYGIRRRVKILTHGKNYKLSCKE